MTIQITVRLPDEQVRYLDTEVAAGRPVSRGRPSRVRFAMPRTNATYVSSKRPVPTPTWRVRSNGPRTTRRTRTSTDASGSRRPAGQATAGGRDPQSRRRTAVDGHHGGRHHHDAWHRHRGRARSIQWLHHVSVVKAG